MVPEGAEAAAAGEGWVMLPAPLQQLLPLLSHALLCLWYALETPALQLAESEARLSVNGLLAGFRDLCDIPYGASDELGALLRLEVGAGGGRRASLLALLFELDSWGGRLLAPPYTMVSPAMCMARASTSLGDERGVTTLLERLHERRRAEQAAAAAAARESSASPAAMSEGAVDGSASPGQGVAAARKEEGRRQQAAAAAAMAAAASSSPWLLSSDDDEEVEEEDGGGGGAGVAGAEAEAEPTPEEEEEADAEAAEEEEDDDEEEEEADALECSICHGHLSPPADDGGAAEAAREAAPQLCCMVASAQRSRLFQQSMVAEETALAEAAPLHGPRLALTSCEHRFHAACLGGYRESLHQRPPGISFNAASAESFACPVCRRGCNVALPLLPHPRTDEWEAREEAQNEEIGGGVRVGSVSQADLRSLGQFLRSLRSFGDHAWRNAVSSATSQLQFAGSAGSASVAAKVLTDTLLQLDMAVQSEGGDDPKYAVQLRAQQRFVRALLRSLQHCERLDAAQGLEEEQVQEEQLPVLDVSEQVLPQLLHSMLCQQGESGFFSVDELCRQAVPCAMLQCLPALLGTGGTVGAIEAEELGAPFFQLLGQAADCTPIARMAEQRRQAAAAAAAAAGEDSAEAEEEGPRSLQLMLSPLLRRVELLRSLSCSSASVGGSGGQRVVGNPFAVAEFLQLQGEELAEVHQYRSTPCYAAKRAIHALAARTVEGSASAAALLAQGVSIRAALRPELFCSPSMAPRVDRPFELTPLPPRYVQLLLRYQAEAGAEARCSVCGERPKVHIYQYLQIYTDPCC